MSEDTQAADMALILEGKIRERVMEATAKILSPLVSAEVSKLMKQHKESMIMEISLAVGKSLQVIESEGRTPLWVMSQSEIEFHNKLKENDHGA